MIVKERVSVSSISIMVCQDIKSFLVGDRFVTELNQPILSRVASWEPQERRWHAVFPRRIDEDDIEHFSRSVELQENSAGVLYSAAQGLRHLETKLVELQEGLAPALVIHFEVSTPGCTELAENK